MTTYVTVLEIPPAWEFTVLYAGGSEKKANATAREARLVFGTSLIHVETWVDGEFAESTSYAGKSAPLNRKRDINGY